jgi:hypothetical protein
MARGIIATGYSQFISWFLAKGARESHRVLVRRKDNHAIRRVLDTLAEYFHVDRLAFHP